MVSNRFGTVTDTAVEYNSKKSALSGSSQETLPLRHITSVRLESDRKVGAGVILVIIGILTLPLLGFGLILIAVGVLYIWGFAKVMVNTAGGDKRPSVAWPWQRDDAEEFVSAVRKELLKAK